MSDTTNVSGVPFLLTPSDGSSWRADTTQETLAVTATPHSDIFTDPASGAEVNAETLLNAATLTAPLPQGDFQFSARVKVDFRSTFDAGVLLLWLDRLHWAKLCFEFSPSREPMVVSVVNRTVSDDANAFVVEGGSVWLRISRIGNVYAFHASTDGSSWRMVRVFALDVPGATAAIGFEAQSPTGDGCDVLFTDVLFSTQRLMELRDGS
jgi:uncharacterized protein